MHVPLRKAISSEQYLCLGMKQEEFKNKHGLLLCSLDNPDCIITNHV